jgi:hypothetical protein
LIKIVKISNIVMLQVIKQGIGELVLARRPKETSKRTYHPWDFLPCEYCLGFYLKSSLWVHVKSCPLKPEKESENNYIRNGRALLSPIFHGIDNDDALSIDQLFLSMKETQKNPGIPEICKNDPVIREFAWGQLERLGTDEERRIKDEDNIRTKVRTLGRGLKKMNENLSDERWHSLSEFLSPQYFRHVLASVKQLALEADSPNLALTLGHYIKQSFLLKISLGIENEDQPMIHQGQSFKILYETHWNNLVSSVANRRQKLRQINKQVKIPSTSDLVTLKNYCVEQLKLIMEMSKTPVDTYQWNKAADLLLVRITIFNKRRIAEVQEIKESDFKASPLEANSDLLASLDVTEQALARR